MQTPKGFPDKWIAWVEIILSSVTPSVLLNGVIGKDFKCKRGVKQGDPLSPLLFELVANLLQSIINDAYAQGFLSNPFPQNHDSYFPIIQYADDTLVVM